MQIETELRTSQLYDACHVLFGSDIDVSVDFLRYLQIPGLKAVYRRKALETHPDRAIALALPPVTLEEQFKKINSAYQELHDYLENPLRFKLIDDGFRKRANQPSQKMHTWSGTQPRHTDSKPEGYRRQFYKGTVPKRALLFGQYIYYYGYISYRQLIDAIIWQKIQRPLIGNIAVSWNWLYEDDIREILETAPGRGKVWGICVAWWVSDIGRAPDHSRDGSAYCSHASVNTSWKERFSPLLSWKRWRKDSVVTTGNTSPERQRPLIREDLGPTD